MRLMCLGLTVWLGLGMAPGPKPDCDDDAITIRASLSGGELGPPAWVEPGMAPSVWALIEAATAADGDDLKRCLLREAEQDARQIVERGAPTVSERFALAVVLGVRANTEGGRGGVQAASQLYRELVEILTIEPGHARARHLLGRLHAGVQRMGRLKRWIATNVLGGATLKTASWEEAEINLSFAERVAPEVADHHLQLANLYRDTGRPDLALAEVEHVLALPADSPLTAAVQAEAAELATRLEG